MKRALTLISAFALIIFSASCDGNNTTSTNASNYVSSRVSSEISSGIDVIEGEWWNSERLNDWGLNKLTKPEAENATYMDYRQNELIKLILTCESMDYITEYAEDVFDFISKKSDKVYKAKSGKRNGIISTFDETAEIELDGYKVYTMIYNHNGAAVWISISGDVNSDGSVNMIFYVSKALG